jgi:hypothetical protein
MLIDYFYNGFAKDAGGSLGSGEYLLRYIYLHLVRLGDHRGLFTYLLPASATAHRIRRESS